jgi:hypothetical protein
MVHEHESKALRAEHAKKAPAEKQPTGRVVGIIKRNWRAYVPLLLIYLAGSRGDFDTDMFVTSTLQVSPQVMLRHSGFKRCLLLQSLDYSLASDYVRAKHRHSLAIKYW